MQRFAQLLGGPKAGSRDAGAEVAAFLAPMSGITDLGMRLAAQKFGASFVVSEMIDSDFYTRGEAASQIKAEGRGITCHIVQIAGCRVDRIGDAARLAEAEGAAAIDINMGCPAKRVVGGFAGSALMRDLEHATTLVRAVVAAVRVPVSLKMRLGWDEGSRTAAELARRAEAEGVALVTVHGRTRCQFYKGRADWAAIRDVVDAVTVPVVANGDCDSLADAREMLARSGAAAIMVGRAAVGRPWRVGQIVRALASGAEALTPVAAAERRDAALAHYETLLSLYGVEQGVRRARKHLAGYATHAGAGSGTARHHALVTTNDPQSVFDQLVDLFEGTPAMDLAA